MILYLNFTKFADKEWGEEKGRDDVPGKTRILETQRKSRRILCVLLTALFCTGRIFEL